MSLTIEDHRKQLKQFEVDRLMKLLKLEVDKNYDGQYTIFYDKGKFLVFFGQSNIEDLEALEVYASLKEAIIEAIIFYSLHFNKNKLPNNSNFRWQGRAYKKTENGEIVELTINDFLQTNPVALWFKERIKLNEFSKEKVGNENQDYLYGDYINFQKDRLQQITVSLKIFTDLILQLTKDLEYTKVYKHRLPDGIHLFGIELIR